MAVGITAFPTSIDDAATLPIPENNASSTITAGIDTDDLLITIADPDEFPDAGEFTIVDSLTAPTKIENVKIESRSGSNFTVEAGGRGAGGTTAQTWTSGAFIECRPNKLYHSSLRGAVLTIQAKLGTGEYINANRITDGSISDAEFGYLNGVTSSIQAQLDAKQAAFGSQNANYVYAGPVSGGAASPAFRALVSADIPDLSSVYSVAAHNHSGVYQPIDQDLTDIAALSGDGLLRRSSNIWAMDSTSYQTTFGDQSANTVYAGPTTGVADAPAFRTLVAADIPDLSSTYSVAGHTHSGVYEPANANIQSHIASTSNPHSVTKSQVGLGSVENTALSTWAGSASVTTLGTVTTGTLGSGAVIGGVTMTLGSDADGDIYYRSSNVLTRLPKGTGLQQLRMNAGATAPEWFTDSGGGLTVGSTAIASGTAGRILYEASGNVLGEAAGITYQTGASPSTTITAQAASYVGLRVNSASTPSTDVFQVSADNGTTTHFKVTSTGIPSGPFGTNSERFGAGQSYYTSATSATIIGANISISATTANYADHNTLIGAGITQSGGGYYNKVTAIGSSILLGGTNQNDIIAIGYSAQVYKSYSIAIGGTVLNTGGGYSVALGASSSIDSTSGIAIGANATIGTSKNAAIVIGRGATAVNANELVIGSSSYPIDNAYFGKGVTNATPTAYTINGTGGSGTNIAGANLLLAGGKGTGTGAGGSVILQSAIVGSSGTSLNTLVSRYYVNGTRKTLTDAATNVFEVALPTLKGCMGVIKYEIFAADATDVQVRSGIVRYSAVNKGGAYTSEVVIVDEGVSASTGTLTATWAIVTGSDKITLEVTPSGSLTETTYYMIYTIENNSEQAITIL